MTNSIIGNDYVKFLKDGNEIFKLFVDNTNNKTEITIDEDDDKKIIIDHDALEINLGNFSLVTNSGGSGGDVIILDSLPLTVTNESDGSHTFSFEVDSVSTTFNLSQDLQTVNYDSQTINTFQDLDGDFYYSGNTNLPNDADDEDPDNPDEGGYVEGNLNGIFVTIGSYLYNIVNPNVPDPPTSSFTEMYKINPNTNEILELYSVNG